jgi:hypothetical protein
MNGPAAGPSLCETSNPAKGRSTMSHLLHALNQPLTGLQCSLELAVAAPRTAEEYVRTLRDALDLATRARILVEAIRELADTEAAKQETPTVACLRNLLRETAGELAPVAEARGVGMQVRADEDLPVRADRGQVRNLLFRTLESALSLCDRGSELTISGMTEHNSSRLSFSWKQSVQPEHSPFSRPELGLLLAQAGWERLGANCMREQNGGMQTVICHMPVVFPQQLRRFADAMQPENVPFRTEPSSPEPVSGGNR